jgi:hypothetical protein
MLAIGMMLFVGLVGAGVGLWAASGERRANNVAGFARAPAGCDTTLDFDSTGTFVVFFETSGEFTKLPGACDAERSYDRDVDDIADPELTLLGPDGVGIDFDVAPEVRYDVDGFVGASMRTVQIETLGDHLLQVGFTSGEPFAVAVGRSPDTGVALLRWAAVASAFSGFVLGGGFLAFATRPRVGPTMPVAPWVPNEHVWPLAPPGFPVPPPTTGATGPPPNTPPQQPLAPTTERDQPGSIWAPPPPSRGSSPH